MRVSDRVDISSNTFLAVVVGKTVSAAGAARATAHSISTEALKAALHLPME